MTIRPIRTLAELEAIEGAWRALWQRDPNATPFQASQWLIPWWRRIGRGELCSLAMYQGQQLVALLPLYIYTQPATGSRDLFPLGIATTDYLDGLFDPAFAHAAASEAFAWLEQHADRWDVIDLQQLRGISPLLAAAPPESWEDQLADSEPCPVLSLPGRVEELTPLLPANLPQNLRYYARRASRLGEVRWDRADDRSWQELYEALLALHRTRWETRQEPGVLADPGVQEAHRESVPGLLQAGMLRMYALRIDGRLIAVLYALADRRSFYYYLAGFDPAYAAISPGNLLIEHAVKEAIGEGIGLFDFLRGREGYKYLWGARDNRTYRRRLFRNLVPQPTGGQT